MAEAAQMVFSSPSAHRYTFIAFKGCQVGYRTWLCWFCLWTKHLRWYIVSPSSALSCDPPLVSSKHSLLIFFILVDGGERAVIFDRFRGVLPKVIGEGTHFRIPLIQVCFFSLSLLPSILKSTISKWALERSPLRPVPRISRPYALFSALKKLGWNHTQSVDPSRSFLHLQDSQEHWSWLQRPYSSFHRQWDLEGCRCPVHRRRVAHREREDF